LLSLDLKGFSEFRTHDRGLQDQHMLHPHRLLLDRYNSPITVLVPSSKVESYAETSNVELALLELFG
jgi:hypothetical protein